jgi:predicted TIM-barrel fold metal-dependent hydrolase
MEYFFNFRKDRAQFAPNGIEAEFQRLYYDTANATHPASMAALLKLVPDTQVTYGSDYPYVPMDTQVHAIQGLGLSEAQVAAIESGNAERLLPRLKT